MAEYWYNTSYHTSLEITPFEVLYGSKPVPLNLGETHDMIIPVAQDMLEQRKVVLQVVKESLQKAQHRMKFFADQHRTERHFLVGDWVYLKLQPYRQQTVAIRASLKLCSKYFGPFQVLEKIGTVAYRLKLPSQSRVHPVFHVSLLKKHVGTTPIVAGSLPEFDQNDITPLVPYKVLQRRQIKRADKLVTQWLIHWKGLESYEASWEDAEFVRSQFPEFQA